MKTALLILAATISIGGETAAPPPPGPQPPGDLCQSFRRNQAGMWCSTGPVTFTGQQGGVVKLSAGVCLKPGSPLNGRDIARELEETCR